MTTLYRDDYVCIGLTSDGALYLSPVTVGCGILEWCGSPNTPLIDQYQQLRKRVDDTFTQLCTIYNRTGNRKALMIGHRLIDVLGGASRAMLIGLVDSGYAPDIDQAWSRLCTEKAEGYRLVERIND